nr:hypothetical protein [Mesorhizobium sp. DCY119]
MRSADDWDFSEERLEAAWSGELGGQLGNLVNRVLTLLASSFSGVTPAVPERRLVREAGDLPEKVSKAFDDYELHLGLTEIFSYLGSANREFTRKEPGFRCQGLGRQTRQSETTNDFRSPWGHAVRTDLRPRHRRSLFAPVQLPACTRNSEYRARRGMMLLSPLAEWRHLLERLSSRGRH